MKLVPALALSLCLLVPALAPAFAKATAGGQDAPLLPPEIDQKKVDDAIARGIAWLRTAASPAHSHAGPHSDELILWTFIHAGVPETDPKFQQLLASILGAPLERTYKAALQAMIFEELNRVKYQDRIWQCAQFLVDNQCATGQWSYGEPTEALKNVPSGGPRDVASAGGKVKEFSPAAPGGPRAKPKVVRKMAVKATRMGPASGDNSNSQYAALGLRACFDGGIRLPEQTVLLAKKWWMESQYASGADKDDKSIASGPYAPPKGWCYCAAGSHQPYASMTAGAVGSLVILDHILDKDWKKDPAVKAGMGWLAAHYSVNANTGPVQHEGADEKCFLYYYLYALERAGILYGTEKIGPNFWYIDGAKKLLAEQRPDGSWEGSSWSNGPWDTCFAILFLKRATRPLVASQAAGAK